MKCRPGYHYVKKHTRKSVNGTRHIVENHCRKNSGLKKSFLYKSNLEYIYENCKDTFKYKKLNRIKGYKQDRGQYDVLIQFWLKYWRKKGLISEDIDPLLIKALIAIESSFREKVITKMPNSSATGLMQLLKTTMNILSRKISKEVKVANVDISQEEAREALVNIAAGTRWLIFKITTSPNRKSKFKKIRIYSGIKYYHSWNEDGEEYAKKVFKVYESSR